jgi:D-alanine-D-alanine ligase
MSKLRVAVLFGGRSAEHEVSLLSARFVLESLDPERFEPALVGIDRSGRWLLQEQALLLSQGRDPRLVKLNEAMPAVSLPPYPGSAGRHLVKLEPGQLAAGAPEELGIDVVFPVLHGPMGEDGTVQGLLELAGVPYVGAGVLGSAVGMDKDVMKRLLIEARLPVLPYRVLRRTRFERHRDKALEELMEVGVPIFVKPANLGSSVGIRRVAERRELAAAIDHAFEFDDKVLIEQGLEAPREIEVAVLGGDDPLVSVPGELVVDHADGFYSYAAKYVDEKGAVARIPAELSDAETAEARALALRTFEALEGEGMARVDLFLDRGRKFWVNEINTIPGLTSISMFPKLMEESGIPPRELVSRLIDDALVRGRRKRARRTAI